MKEKNPGRKTAGDTDGLIPVEMERSFHEALKRGIYQELHDRDFLSDAQLNELLGRNM